MRIAEGTVVKFVPTGHAGRRVTVRVNGSPQHTYIGRSSPSNPSGAEYIMFSGVRVRPSDYQVSFGDTHSYTARFDTLTVVQEAKS